MARAYEGEQVRFRLPPEQRVRVEEIAAARAQVGRPVSKSTLSAVLRTLVGLALETIEQDDLVTN